MAQITLRAFALFDADRDEVNRHRTQEEEVLQRTRRVTDRLPTNGPCPLIAAEIVNTVRMATAPDAPNMPKRTAAQNKNGIGAYNVTDILAVIGSDIDAK